MPSHLFFRRSAPRARYLWVLVGSYLGLWITVQGQTLVVQGPNSPYTFSAGAASYDNIYVGQSGNGTLNHSGGTLIASTGQLYLGYNTASRGAYNLSGGSLFTISTDLGDSGTGIFTLSGTGVHSVSGSLDLAVYTGSSGTYNLNGGTLNPGYVGGGAGTSTFNFNGGTLTARTNTASFLQNLTYAYVGAGGAIIDTAGYNVTVAQNLEHTNASGAAATDGGLTKLGGGTLTLTGNNSYTGGTKLQGGVLTLGSTGALGSVGALTFGGGTLQYSTTNTTDYSARFSTADNQAFAVDTNGQNVTYATGLASNGGSLAKLGAGTLTLTGANTYTNNTVVSAGTLTIIGSVTGGSDSILTVDGPAGAAATVNLSGTGSLSTSGTTVGYKDTGVFNQSGGTHTTSTLTVGRIAASIYNMSDGNLNAGRVVLGQFGYGTFNQTGGTVTLQDGAMEVGSGVDGGGGNGGGAYNLSGGSLKGTGAVLVGAYGGSGVFTQTGGAFTIDNNLYLSYHGGSGTYNLSGATSRLSAYNVFVGTDNGGTFNQSGGTLTMSNTFYVGLGGTSTYTLSGTGSLSAARAFLGDEGGSGTINQTGGSFVVDPSRVLIVGFDYGIDDSSGQIIPSSGTYNLSGGTLTTGETLISNSRNVTGTFTQTGGIHTTGTLALSHYDNTSRGIYTLAGGVLNVGLIINRNPDYAQVGTSIFHFAGGTLQASGSNAAFFQDLTTVDVQGNGGAKIDTQGYSVTVAQDLLHDTSSGARATDGGLTKLGSGTLTLTGNNTYTGGTTFAGGTLNVGSAKALGTSGTLSFTGGTLQFSAASAGVDLSSRFSTAANQPIRLDTNGQNVVVGSSLSGSGTSLTKLGAGTLTLTGRNNYTGPTNVNAGTLLLSRENNGGAQITVQNSGSVLGGTGSTVAAVSVIASGTLNPGNNVGMGGASSTVGTLTVGALTLDSTSFVVLDLNSGSLYDRLVSNGAIALGGSTLTLNVNSSTTAYSIGQTLTLLHANSGGLNGTFGNFVDNGLYSHGADTFRANYTATDFTLTVTAVPEPATWAGAALLLAGAGWTLRRRPSRA